MKNRRNMTVVLVAVLFVAGCGTSSGGRAPAETPMVGNEESATDQSQQVLDERLIAFEGLAEDGAKINMKVGEDHYDAEVQPGEKFRVEHPAYQLPVDLRMTVGGPDGGPSSCKISVNGNLLDEDSGLTGVLCWATLGP